MQKGRTIAHPFLPLTQASQNFFAACAIGHGHLDEGATEATWP